MTRSRSVFFAVLVFFSLSMLLSALALSVFSYPYPRAKIAAVKKYAALDMGGVLFGARRLAADIAWIELLQYYGSPETPLEKDEQFDLSWEMTRYLFGLGLAKEECREPGCTEKGHHHADFSTGTYGDIYPYCLRVTELDPFFSYVYLYGAGALAWNLNRPDEAIKLLEDGIASIEKFSPEITKDVHQPFWQYHLYLSAIIYSKSGKFNEMTGLLETAVKQPKCPNMIKAILANIYQKNGNPARALKLWVEIYDSKDPTYMNRSLAKISELKTISGF